MYFITCIHKIDCQTELHERAATNVTKPNSLLPGRVPVNRSAEPPKFSSKESLSEWKVPPLVNRIISPEVDSDHLVIVFPFRILCFVASKLMHIVQNNLFSQDKRETPPDQKPVSHMLDSVPTPSFQLPCRPNPQTVLQTPNNYRNPFPNRCQLCLEMSSNKTH